MRTKEMLDKMPKINRDYLENLKSSIQKMKDLHHPDVVEEYKQVAKGYIKSMVDCGVVDDFKTVWCWFTL